ncbi:hypothetical protein [Streptomyces sp. NPDC020747]|uniref:hypothetical protein n=1 Tax=Streptomyces sp. NPDC020747 TaxID=3365086 RepID=UPI0037A3017E
METKHRRTHRKSGKAETKTVHATSSLPPEQAGPPQLTELTQNHSPIEAPHHVRDVTYGQDASRIRTGTTPRATATLRNLAMAAHACLTTVRADELKKRGPRTR